MDFFEAYQVLRATVVENSADTPKELRQRVFAFARALCEKPNTENPFDGTFGKWVENVARHAYKTLPDEVEAMKREGQSEDEIFEITIVAAVGAAAGRYEQALASIDEGYAE